jgi:hypothetical protein
MLPMRGAVQQGAGLTEIGWADFFAAAHQYLTRESDESRTLRLETHPEAMISQGGMGRQTAHRRGYRNRDLKLYPQRNECSWIIENRPKLEAVKLRIDSSKRCGAGFFACVVSALRTVSNPA